MIHTLTVILSLLFSLGANSAIAQVQCPDLTSGIYVCIDQDGDRSPLQYDRTKHAEFDAIVLFGVDERKPDFGYPCVNREVVNSLCGNDKHRSKDETMKCAKTFGDHYVHRTATVKSGKEFYYNKLVSEFRKLDNDKVAATDTVIIDIRRIDNRNFNLKFFVNESDGPLSDSKCTLITPKAQKN